MISVADAAIVEAARAQQVAPQLCAPTGCAWYHGIWPSLRSLGLVASPDRHRSLFARAVAATPGEPRVLVSGAADAAMVSLVIDELGSRTPGRLAVLDRCATPVLLSTEHGERAGVTVEGIVADVVDVEDPEGFDLVCTHGLLPITPPERRAAVAASWFRLLRPGGVVATTSSLRDGEGRPVRFSAEAAAAFGERAESAARAAIGERPSASAAEIGGAARTWALQAEVHPVRAGDLRTVLEDAGFTVVRLDERTVDGPLERAASGPWTARTARYVEVIAVRPLDEP